jgi:aldose 1-epimerase
MQFKNAFFLVVLVSLVAGCTRKENTVSEIVSNSSDAVYFGTLPDGQKVNVYTLTNNSGMEAKVINYGGIVLSLKVQDKNGALVDVVLGYDSLSDYLKASPYFGALIGRYGNRIGGGKFTLNGETYALAQNDNGNHLHGGLKGFDKVYWNIEPIDQSRLKLTYKSVDGEEGYPGNLDVQVTYSLSEDNTFQIEYLAKTDKPTVVNLTQHTYFNLGGHDSGDILNHQLQLNAPSYLPVDKGLIPTGKIESVENTPFDFRAPNTVGARINDGHEQMVIGKGYDHCWVFEPGSDATMRSVATLGLHTTGIQMEVLTTEPAIQFYSGNFLDGKNIGKGGHAYQHRYGLCLETQHFPDSPNKPEFPSVVLNPDSVYHSVTAYRFSIAE